MAKNLFGNLFDSDDLDKKYQKENDENIKRANAEKFDDELKMFDGVKQDIVWATRFDNFAKNNKAVLKESEAYIKNLDLYHQFYDASQKIIQEDIRIREEYALKKAQEMQKQKEEQIRKRKEYVLEFDKRIQKLGQDKKADKDWIKNVLDLNNEFSSLNKEEKSLVNKQDLLKELVKESSYISSALSITKDIASLQKSPRNQAFTKKYEDIKETIKNKKVLEYLDKDCLKIFASLEKEYLELKYNDLVVNAQKLISLNTIDKTNVALFEKYLPLIDGAPFDLNLIIKDFSKKWDAQKKKYKDYLASVEQKNILNEANKIYNGVLDENKKTLNYSSDEKKSLARLYDAAINKYQIVKKTPTNDNLKQLTIASNDFKKAITDIEKIHEKKRSDQSLINSHVNNYLNGLKKKYPLSNYRSKEQQEINAILKDVENELLKTFAVSSISGKVVYVKDAPLDIVARNEKRIQLIKTDSVLKQEEEEKARIEAEKKRIAAIEAKNHQIDQIFMSAQKGDAEAMYLLAELYYHGDGVSESPKDAVKWYEKAAKKGHPKAIEKMGDCYYNGYGVEQSFKEAAKWYKKIK